MDIINEEGRLLNEKLTMESTIAPVKLYEKANLTYSEVNVCTYLFNEGPKSMGEIASFIDKRKSNTTRVIDRLVDLGLVTRAACKEDRRKLQIRLTDDCRKELDVYSTRLEELFCKNLNSNCNEGEIENLIKCYEYIISVLKKFK